jgi:ligand-binding sensor domain-containing protein/DNA-binding CsgD family transcriptional regulator
MKIFKSYNIKSLFLFIFILPTNYLYCQVKNIGIPEIKNYKRSDYKGGTQNWDIDQDQNGAMYFANNDGLLQFDGTEWHKYSVPSNSDVKSVEIDSSGKIYIGSYNEFGYFKANSKGKLDYYSLSKFLDKKIVNSINVIWKIHLYKDEVLFQSFGMTFVLKKNKITLLKPFSRFQFSFKVKEKLYFQDVSMGLLEYRNGKLYPLVDTKILNNTEVWGMFPMADNKLLIATIDKGLFLYDNKKLLPWENETNSLIKKNSCLGGTAINKNLIALNTVLGGVVICNTKGEIIQNINRKKGLQNNTILCSRIDSKKNLWLGLDNGIAFVNENSPLTYFGYSYDLGTVYSSVVYENNLYVATNQGVFYHPMNKPFKEGAFFLVEGTTGQAWNIQLIDNQLICAHNRGAMVIDGNKKAKILDEKGYLSYKKIPNHPNFMIGSNYIGFSLFEKKPNGWQFIWQISGYNKTDGKFEIENESVWFIKEMTLYKIGLSDDFKTFKSIKTYKNLPNSNKFINSIQRINSNLYFQTDNHFFKYSKNNNTFYEDKKITALFKKIPNVNTIYEDSKGNIWYVFNKTLGVLMKTSNNYYNNIITPFSNLTGNLVYDNLSINTLNTENIFIGLTDGLAHYDPTVVKKFNTKPKVLITQFANLEDTLIYGNKNNSDNYKIRYEANYIKFTYSSPTYENIGNVKYSYKLEGFTDQWSKWSTEHYKEYTNLREGNYYMKVKAKNSYNIESDEAIVSFTVTPPWYRSFLAYFIYIIVLVTTFYYINRTTQIKIRKNKYYETIEQRRLYLEKESKIRQEQFELEKEIEKLKNDKLKTKILAKDKELVNNSLQVVKKNKILNGIIHKLKDINVDSLDESTKFQFTKLNKSITKEVNADKSWTDLEKHIKNVHYDFLKRLKEKYPTISPRELDLSTYLLMNMSTKEIAEIMNISNGGVELARYRLRKKLELNKKENLIGFLMNI